MSHEFRIHFDDTDPGARNALAVLTAWEQQGYSPDEVVTQALLALGDGRQQDRTGSTMAHLRDLMRDFRQLLQELKMINIATPVQAQSSTGETVRADEPAQQEPELSDVFVAAVRKAARPGLRLQE